MNIGVIKVMHNRISDNKADVYSYMDKTNMYVP